MSIEKCARLEGQVELNFKTGTAFAHQGCLIGIRRGPGVFEIVPFSVLPQLAKKKVTRLVCSRARTMTA
jgi:hypothetical protein